MKQISRKNSCATFTNELRRNKLTLVLYHVHCFDRSSLLLHLSYVARSWSSLFGLSLCILFTDSTTLCVAFPSLPPPLSTHTLVTCLLLYCSRVLRSTLTERRGRALLWGEGGGKGYGVPFFPSFLPCMKFNSDFSHAAIGDTGKRE